MAMACGFTNSGPLPMRLSGEGRRARPSRNNYTARHDSAIPRCRINPHHYTEKVINHEPLAGRFDGNGQGLFKGCSSPTVSTNDGSHNVHRC